MGSISEDVISSVIEGLLILCKEKISDDELLEPTSTPASSALAGAIKVGTAFADDFDRMESSGALWSAIIESVEGFKLLGDQSPSGDDMGSVTGRLPVHVQRLLGAIFSVAELLAQENNKNAVTLIESLHRVLGTNFPDDHLLDLFQNYRNYFPYSYMFIRRIGRTPNAPSHVWENELNRAPPVTKPSDDVSDVIRRNEKDSSSIAARSDDDNSDKDNHRHVDRSDPKWLVSDSEEGEDSEDEESIDHRRHTHMQQKKRLTRMSASPSRRVQSGGFVPVPSYGGNSSSRADDDMVMEIEDVSFTSDISAVPTGASVRKDPLTPHKKSAESTGWSSASTAGPANNVQAPKQRKSLVVDITRSTSQRPNDRTDSVNSFNSFDDSDTEAFAMALPLSNQSKEDIDIKDLKKTFQNSITAPGAEHAQKQTLSRNIRYALGAHELADRVLQAGSSSTPYVTWDILLKLAGLSDPVETAIKDKTVEPAASVDRNDTALVIPQEKHNDLIEGLKDNIRPQRRSEDVSSYVDSGDKLARSSQSESGAHKNSGTVQQHNPIDVAAAMFNRIDRDGNGVVTHIELIKALRGDRKVAAALKLPSHIRQEDRSRDSYMNCFNEIDKDGTGTISLTEFLNFLDSCQEEESNDSLLDRSFQTTNRRGHVDEESPLAPARKPVRLLDPEDRRAGVRQPKVTAAVKSDDRSPPRQQMKPKLMASRSKSERGSGTVRSRHETSNVSSGTVYRKGDRGTELLDESGSHGNTRMSHMPTVRESANKLSNVNKSMDSVHAGPLAAKHRRLVGGESVGNEYTPDDSSPVERNVVFNTDERDSPSRPPLNPVTSTKNVDVVMSPEKIPPNTLSRFARATNILFEGYLDKKSQLLGLWQKRYFVLVQCASLNSNHPKTRIELRIFTKATMSAWGMLPLQLRRVVPLAAMESIDAVPDKKKIGTLFKIVERIATKPIKRAHSSNDLNNPDSDRNSDNGSVISDLYMDGTRIMTLRASDPESRLAWVTTLRTEVDRIEV